MQTFLHAASQDLAPNGVVTVSYLHLSTLVLALAVVLVVISRLSLDIEKKLCIGALRCFVQLSALGLILVPILTYNSPPLVIAYIIFMMFVASVESASRVPYVFDSLLLVCFISIAAAATIFGAFTFYVVLGTRLDAQYAIPIIGMIMGMSLTAVSVTVASIVTHIAERKESVEILLVLGATRWEAARHAVKSSIVLGLTPLLNSMSVSGLVSIPGMMTGQIIGGTSPSLAAKYQIVVLYAISGAATVAALSAALLTICVLIDPQHRIRSEKLSPRAGNRYYSIMVTAQYLISSFASWRRETAQQRSPFPPHVNYPVPPSATPTTPISKTREVMGYGATSDQDRDREE